MALHWIIMLAAILPLWLLQNVIHELAHGLAMKIGWGWRFSIYPFPSKRLGRFTFAHVTYSPGPDSVDPGETGRALVSIMPKCVNTVFAFAAAVASLSLLQAGLLSAAAVLALFLVCNYIDFTVGMLAVFGSNEMADLHRFKRCLHLSDREVRIWASLLVLLLGGIIGAVCGAAIPRLL